MYTIRSAVPEDAGDITKINVYTWKELGEQNLDDYEAEYGYSLDYITLRDAIRNNEGITDTTNIPWIYRDTAIMRLLLSDEEKS